ncbi:MAG: hypothetical protein NT018_13085 [Armatimonadetes bacterium]|nr:hypothetical protein [Armatimonadota bacterium]
MGLVVFSDNDIILKLSEYNLLYNACDVLGVGLEQVMVLSTAIYIVGGLRDKVANGKNGKYTLAGLNRAIRFLESVYCVEDYPELSWFVAIDNVDIGEAQLATWAVDLNDCSMLLTGDKKFMNALANHPAARHIYDGLCGRVVCLEELIKALIRHMGFDHVRQAVASAPNCDQALNQAFGNRYDQPEAQVVEALDSHIRNILQDVGDGWLKCL